MGAMPYCQKANSSVSFSGYSSFQYSYGIVIDVNEIKFVFQ